MTPSDSSHHAPPAPEGPILASRWRTGLMILGLVVLAGVMSWFRAVNMELKIAEFGFGLQQYAAMEARPEHFARDWPTSIQTYDFSVVMRTQRLLVNDLGLPSMAVTYGSIVLHCFFYVFSAAVLAWTLFRNRALALVFAAAAISAPLAGLNLSNHGEGLGNVSPHLYYGYANAFVLLALAAFARERWSLMSLLLALAAVCHMVTAVFAAVFAGGYLLYRFRLLARPGVVLPLVGLGAVFIALYAWVASAGYVATAGIPDDEWIKLSRVFSYHWHPFTQGFLTYRAHLLLFPLIGIVVLYVLALREPAPAEGADAKMIAGMLAVGVLSIVGVVFSDVWPLATVVKISPQRSTFLITFIATLYVVRDLYRRATGGGWIVPALAAWAYLVLLFADPGLPLLPYVLLLWTDVRRGRVGPWPLGSRARRAAAIGLLGVVSLVAAVLVAMAIVEWTAARGLGLNDLNRTLRTFVYEWPRPLQHLTPHRQFDLVLSGGRFLAPWLVGLLIALMLMTPLLGCASKGRRGPAGLAAACAGLLLLVLASAAPQHAVESQWRERNGPRAQAFLEVQRWAQSSTPADSLFLQDPGRPHGWRDFSERSGFGTLMEWAHLSHVYTPRLETWEQALVRMRDFGFDPDAIAIDGVILQDDPKLAERRGRARAEVSERYHTLSAVALRELASRHGITHAIYENDRRQNTDTPASIPPAFENDLFIVYDLRDGGPQP